MILRLYFFFVRPSFTNEGRTKDEYDQRPVCYFKSNCMLYLSSVPHHMIIRGHDLYSCRIKNILNMLE